MIDLHLHTSASDGQYSPTEVVELAKAAGITTLAVTDHDTVAGLREAERAANLHNIQFLSGIELSAAGADQLHILGYQFNPEDCALLELCEQMRLGRANRKFAIESYLQRLGLDITAQEADHVAGGAAVGRPHFARLLVEKGYVKTIEEAFDQYLATDEFAKIERKKPTAQECITVIRAAGGHAVLAHPALLKVSEKELKKLLALLVQQGLEGLECYHSSHTSAQQAEYAHLAQEFQLLITAGSDFHGEKVKPSVFITGWESAWVTLTANQR